MFGKPSGSQKGGKEKTKGEQEKRSMPEKNEEFYKGLCMNCANRHECLLPKSEGGVWHCEEYLEDS